jgi:predicted deacylase
MSNPGKTTRFLTADSREGEQVRVPVATVTGAAEGPRLLVVAGVHGSEYVGIHATRLLFQETDPAALHGTLVTVPCFGVPAFYGLAAHTSPVDGLDPGRAFPGDPDGSYTQRAAHLVWSDLVEGSAAVIDVHGGDLEEHLVEYSQITRSGDEEVDRAGEELARSLGFPLFVRAPRPKDVSGGSGLFVAAAANGIPGVLAEAGSHGELDHALARAYCDALRGALVHLGMLDGELPGTREPQVLHRFEGVRAPVEGFWMPACRKGDTIRAGQAIGEIHDLFGEKLADVVSHEGGVILGVISTPARREGDMLIGLATLEP